MAASGPGDDQRDYDVKPFPATRQIIVESGSLAVRRHISHALLEIDVTQARRLMREYKQRSGESLSFTAFIVACFARAVAAQPAVQAYRNWRNQLIIFHDVDVVTMVEPERGAVAIPHVIRDAGGKTLRAIHDEIRAVQTTPQRSRQSAGQKLAARVPGFVRGLVMSAMLRNPHWLRRMGGTVIVTSVGMFGRGGGWGISFLPMHTLGLTIGGIAEKPGVIDGRIEVREFLDLTISLDHDIVDGAPAARFCQQLKQLIESAYGLDGV